MENFALFPLKYLFKPWQSLLFMGVHENGSKAPSTSKNVSKPQTSATKTTTTTTKTTAKTTQGSTTAEASAASPPPTTSADLTTSSEILTTAPTTSPVTTLVTTSAGEDMTTLPSTAGGTMATQLSTSTGTISRLAVPPTHLPFSTFEESTDYRSPSENDPRTGWIYFLRRHELETEMARYNLSTEGSVATLRRRFSEYIKNSRFTDVNHDFSYSPRLLESLRISRDENSGENLNPPAHGTNVSYSLQPPIPATLHNYPPSSEEVSIREILGLPPNASFRVVLERLMSLSQNDSTNRNLNPRFSVPDGELLPTQQQFVQLKDYRRPQS